MAVAEFDRFSRRVDNSGNILLSRRFWPLLYGSCGNGPRVVVKSSLLQADSCLEFGSFVDKVEPEADLQEAIGCWCCYCFEALIGLVSFDIDIEAEWLLNE